MPLLHVQLLLEGELDVEVLEGGVVGVVSLAEVSLYEGGIGDVLEAFRACEGLLRATVDSDDHILGVERGSQSEADDEDYEDIP